MSNANDSNLNSYLLRNSNADNEEGNWKVPDGDKSKLRFLAKLLQFICTI